MWLRSIFLSPEGDAGTGAADTPTGGGSGADTGASAGAVGGQGADLGVAGGGAGEQKSPVLGDLASGGGASSGAEAPKFDLSKWDGRIESIPEEATRDFVQALWDRKQKEFEAQATTRNAEWAKRDGEYAERQKQFDAQAATHQAEIAKLQRQIEVYKALSDGDEDPRIADLTKTNAEMQAKLEAFEKAQAEAERAAEDKWAADFRQANKDVFEDAAKQTHTFSLMDLGWSPDAAVQLARAGDKALTEAATKLVQEMGLSQDKHVRAIELAKAQLGMNNPPRQPRAAAKVTAGAKDTANPNRAPGLIRNMKMDDARAAAAARALGSST